MGADKIVLWAVAVCLIVALVWSPALFNGFCADDVYLIVENDLLHQPGAAWKMFSGELWRLQAGGWKPDYYRPVANISFIVDSRLYGESPAGFHATNVVVHALVALLLTFWLSKIGLRGPIAAAGALLFGLHPALADAVAWIAGRTEPLAALCVVIYLILDQRREAPVFRVLSLAALAAGLLTKETAVVAPVVAVAADVRRGVGFGRAVAQRWDAALVFAAWLGLRANVVGALITHGQTAVSGIEVAARLTAIPHLLGVLVLPWLGRVDYGPGLPASALAPAAAAGVALATALGYLAFRDQRRRAAGIHLTPVALLTLAAAASVLPVCVAVLVKATIAQRLLYLPAMFAAPAVAALVMRRREAWFALGLAAAALAAASVDRIPQWDSTHSLWRAAAAAPHASALARSNLAKGLHDEGQLADALLQLDVALADEPNFVGRQLRAVIYTEIGCYDLAVPDYQQALQMNPGEERTTNNLASVFGEMGRYDEAVQLLSSFSARFGGPAFIRRNLERLQKERDSKRAAGAPAGVSPEETCGDPSVAAARARDPRFLSGRAAARMREGASNQAWILLKAALAIDPSFAPARLNLARWHALNGQAPEARKILEDVIARDPQNEAARRMLERLSSAQDK